MLRLIRAAHRAAAAAWQLPDRMTPTAIPSPRPALHWCRFCSAAVPDTYNAWDSQSDCEEKLLQVGLGCHLAENA